jgi:Ca-activated chloride channel homolog
VKSNSQVKVRLSMKLPAIREAITIALIFFCAQMNGAQSTDLPSSQSSSGSATIPSGQIFIMQLDTPLHTRTTRKGDKIEFHTAADIVLDNRILIPNHSLVRGTVTKALRAGRLFGKAEIQFRFDYVQLAGPTEIPIQASITRAGFDPVDSKSEGDPKLKSETGTSGDVKAIASASAQGAVIGVLTRGARGAVYGATTGAAISVIGGALKRGPDIDLPRKTMFEARLDKSIDIQTELVSMQNTPAATPPAAPQLANAGPQPIQVAKTETASDEPIIKPRPILKRWESSPPSAEPSEKQSEADDDAHSPSAASSPAETINAKPADMAAGGINIRVNVKMVQVDTVVRDRSGRMLEGLRMEEFRIYEDGALQEIASISQDQLPLAVAIVVDRSSSIASYIAELRRIATRTLYDLKPQDEVCLFSFAADVQRLEDLTTDRQRIAAAIDRIHAGGFTNIMDALHEAVRYLANAAPDRRHAIILISDNQQNAHPQASESVVITKALEREVVVYSLKTSGTLLQLGLQLPSLLSKDPVSKVVQETGGEVIKVGGVHSLDDALGKVISRLRTSYSLGYYPSSSNQSGRFHSISVRLTDKFGKAGSDYFIYARRGYYAVGPSS